MKDVSKMPGRRDGTVVWQRQKNVDWSYYCSLLLPATQVHHGKSHDQVCMQRAKRAERVTETIREPRGKTGGGASSQIWRSEGIISGIRDKV